MAFKSKYSEAQKSAVVVAQLAQQISAKEAARRAGDGSLAPDLDPFEVPEATCRDWAGDARREARMVTEAARDPADALAGAAGEVVALLADVRTRVKRKRNGATPDDVSKLARATREVAAMLRAVQGDGASGGANGSAAPDPRTREGDAPGFLDGLAG
jgi:hypothetical protein